MASSSGQERSAVSNSDVDLLLHPELLSQDFMQLMLNEKHINTRDRCSRDRLTDLFLRHVIPLPQRTLPDNRWGRRMERSRGSQKIPVAYRSDSSSRKRPLIVFDGSSSHSGPLKVKKSEETTVSTGVNDRLKPPPAANPPNPIRRLAGNSSSSINRSSDTGTILKGEPNSSVAMKSSEVKRKIQHVTWP